MSIVYGIQTELQPNRKNVSIISHDELRKLRNDVDTEKSKQNREAAILSRGELDRIKRSTKVETREQMELTKTMLASQKDAQMAQTKERKKRMVEMDKERQKKLPPSDTEQFKIDYNNGLLRNAQRQMDEELDDVKHMNKMCLYSKVVTIRDQQLGENKRLEQEWVDEQKKLDLMMEVERLRALTKEEQENAYRATAQRHGALVIVDQIKEREIERIKQRELLEMEKHQMMSKAEELRQQDIKAAEIRKGRNQQLVQEVAASNKFSLAKKAERAFAEREEDQKIVRYN